MLLQADLLLQYHGETPSRVTVMSEGGVAGEGRPGVASEGRLGEQKLFITGMNIKNSRAGHTVFAWYWISTTNFLEGFSFSLLAFILLLHPT